MEPREIKSVCDALANLLIRKNTDYGNSFEEQFNEYGTNSIIIRLDDKIRRLKTLQSNSPKVAESTSDTLFDIAGYALLGFLCLEKQIANEPIETDPSINQLCEEAFATAISKGWHDEDRETGTMLALIHSEVSEALEADRKGDSENFAEELADVCIRIFDLCGSKDIDLQSAILKKMEFNKSRPHKHGGKAY